MNKYLITAALLLITVCSKAQRNFQYIISTAGAYAKAEGKNISYTIGQYAVFPITTKGASVNANNNYLTQQTGLSENEGNSSVIFDLFPNPTSNIANVSLRYVKSGSYSLEVFNMMGYCVLTTKIDVSNGAENNTVLDMSNISSGQYLVRITDPANAKYIKSTKVIKQ